MLICNDIIFHINVRHFSNYNIFSTTSTTICNFFPQQKVIFDKKVNVVYQILDSSTTGQFVHKIKNRFCKGGRISFQRCLKLLIRLEEIDSRTTLHAFKNYQALLPLHLNFKNQVVIPITIINTITLDNRC